MKITAKQNQYDIYGETKPAGNGGYIARGTISKPSPYGSGVAFETSFETQEPYPTEEAAHSGGIAFAKELISTYWAGIMPRQVLLVEDNPGDIPATQEAFRDNSPSIHLHVARDGAEAMAFLKREGAFVNAPRPDLILLDLNLPKMDGREVLAQVKGNSNLKTIPIAVLTSSANKGDIASSYQLHANCYLAKPGEFDKFRDLVKSISDFWLGRVELPSTDSP
jgi:two-component system, chemotaxis family, response regulator Rcp1